MTAPVKERGTRRNLPLHFRSVFPFAAAFPQRFSVHAALPQRPPPEIPRGEKISHEGWPAVFGSRAETF